MRTAGRGDGWVQVILAVMLLVSYAYFLPRRVDWNQNGRLDLVLAMVDQGRLSIDEYRGNTGDYAHFGEHYYSDKAPGASFLGVPFYAAFRTIVRVPAIEGNLRAVASKLGAGSLQDEAGLFPWPGYFALALYATTFGAIILPSVVVGLLLYQLARRLGATTGAAAALTLVYGLGTTALPYGSAFYGHMLAAACLFGAFYLCFTLREWGKPALALAGTGFLLGWAIITEYPMVLPAVVIGLYAITQAKDKRPLLWAVAAGLIPAALLVAYDMAIYGTPIPAGYQYSELWQEQVNTGFMTLTFPTFERLWGITCSPFRGLFFLSPALLLFVPGAFEMGTSPKGRAACLTILGVVVSLFLFNASSAVWWGGFAIGPRYVSPAVPFLALLIAPWLAKGRWRRWVFLAAGLLSILSVWAQFIPSIKFYPPEMYRFPLIEFALPALARGEVALNLGMALGWSGPASLAPLFALLLVLTALVWRLSRGAPENDPCLVR